MPFEKDLTEFPDVQAKLQKPTKQSAFEKQKAEAEAKRKREAAETAAVYKDFLKSFDDDDDNDGNNNRTAARHIAGNSGGIPPPPRQRPGSGNGGLIPPPPTGPGGSRRHFGASGSRNGPGSLGPPPMGFGKKRSFQDFSRPPDDSSAREGPSVGASSLSVPRAFRTSDDEDEDMGNAGSTADRDRAAEKAISRPTLRLTNLPPGLSASAIKALIPDNLMVEQVKFQAPAGLGGSEKKCAAAIVVLSQDTPANEIEAAVSALQNRYLGYGHYLSLHRHLSSAVATSSAALNSLAASNADTQPFGAKPVEQKRQDHNSDRRGGHHQHRGGFAPPPSYSSVGAGAGAGVNRSNLLHVPVRPPADIKTTKLINMVIEGVLANGPEFEALLMSRPEVQREEKWAWIWDARSQGGTWYRWRLWEVVTGAQNGKLRGKYVPIFDGSHAWKAPDKKLPFEYTTRLDDFISDSDYNSSDDEDVEGGGGDGEAGGGNEDEKTFLNPLEKAKLTHLLARLPTTLSKLRKGDIARVSTFAIMHASRGVEEVADMIVANVERPFALTAANPQRKSEAREAAPGGGAEDGGGGGGSSSNNEAPDVSSASLVGLYVISDILSSSSTSGVRHAWRFRQLFESTLRNRRVFEHLGSMAEKLRWGRLRAEKWKRSVNLVLNLWEGWCVFPNESQQLFARSFENPPSVGKTEDGSAGTGRTADESQKKGSKWKVVEATQHQAEAAAVQDRGEPIDEDDVAGEPIDEDDVEGEPIDDDVEGEPIDEDELDGGDLMDEDQKAPTSETPGDHQGQDDAAVAAASTAEATRGGREEDTSGMTDENGAAKGPPVRKPRMRAADMFPDSDASDGSQGGK
ncbi:U2-associated protein SR140 [Geosmithia morbida]|uniref:U2-associated protein SR140 n=1 Tax=Geosmithia morbida TaxID=1094350 RepID=A0A9P4YYV9_9HYPO|nr:U2-associated protein SR140 [Geosmithia morbida]KAF4125616.1 U2-associated protein SR140 [Geosmithia morbida]